MLTPELTPVLVGGRGGGALFGCGIGTAVDSVAVVESVVVPCSSSAARAALLAFCFARLDIGSSDSALALASAASLALASAFACFCCRAA